jgi:hypothetical protein
MMVFVEFDIQKYFIGLIMLAVNLWDMLIYFSE